MSDVVFWVLVWALLALVAAFGWVIVRQGADGHAWDDWEAEVRAHEAWLARRERERRRPLERWRDDDPAA